MRMSPESFKYLLNVVGPAISKQDTKFRKAISASQGDARCRKSVATTENMKSLVYTDKQDKHFKDRNKKKLAWIDVAKEINESGKNFTISNFVFMTSKI